MFSIFKTTRLSLINLNGFSVRNLNHHNVDYMSKLFLPSSNQKTLTESSDKNTNVDLLIQNGLIDVMNSGHIALLPFMNKAFEKLIKIIDEEMQNIGAQKLQLPFIYNKSLLKASNRLENFNTEIYSLSDKRKQELYLAPTHEEAITSIVSNCLPLGINRLPMLLYQIDRKFRDELRPKFGLMRLKEFVMKDLYSFHADEDCASKTYEDVCNAYFRIFERLGIKVYKAHASNGSMGGKFSHEFLLMNKNGEDQMYLCNSCNTSFNEEIFQQINSQGEDTCPSCKSKVVQEKAIEIGHTFFLGQKYSKVFNANAKLDHGLEPYIMGCYGLGVTRILGAVLDQLSSSSYLKWPSAIVPYDVSIVLAKPGSKEDKLGKTNLMGDQIANHLKSLGLNVLVDDRKKTIGFKVKHNQVIGIPKIIVLGKHILEPVPRFELITPEKTELITHMEIFQKIR